MHFLALKLCNYLGSSRGRARVATHWAQEKAACREDLTDAELMESMLPVLRDVPGVRYSKIAIEAMELGRRKLAMGLLEHEPVVTDQVRLFMAMGDIASALDRAIDAGIVPLVLKVILQARRSQPLHEVLDLIRVRPEARDLFVSYCRQCESTELTHDVLLGLELSGDAGLTTLARATRLCPFATIATSSTRGDHGEGGAPTQEAPTSVGRMSTDGGVSATRSKLLQEAARLLSGHIETKSDASPSGSQMIAKTPSKRSPAASSRATDLSGMHMHLCAKAARDQDRLLSIQGELEQLSSRRGQLVFCGLSVAGTVERCLQNGMVREAQIVQEDFGLSDLLYASCQVRALSNKRAWTALETLVTDRKFVHLNMDRVLDIALPAGCPQDVALRLAARISDSRVRARKCARIGVTADDLAALAGGAKSDLIMSKLRGLRDAVSGHG